MSSIVTLQIHAAILFNYMIKMFYFYKNSIIKHSCRWAQLKPNLAGLSVIIFLMDNPLMLKSTAIRMCFALRQWAGQEKKKKKHYIVLNSVRSGHQRERHYKIPLTWWIGL